jgi:alkylation response protein AidB-like acyl-CoA dehydrogenase
LASAKRHAQEPVREAELIDLPLTEREQELVAEARRFAANVIGPHAATWERTRQSLPRDVFRQYAACGFSGLQVPVEYGGQGVSFLCKVRIAEIMAQSCFAATFALNNSQSTAARLARGGTEDQKNRYLPRLLSGELVSAPAITEPGGGSDATAMTTHAAKVDGGWRINGQKAWITNGAHADLAVLYAQTQKGAGARGIASFFVDLHATGVERSRVYPMMGGAAIGAAELTFRDVFVPDADVIAPPGAAFKRAMAGITAARTHVAAMANGVVEECLSRAVDYAGQRFAFGVKLLDHQGLRWSLADVATDLAASRLLAYHAAELIHREEEAIFAASQAKSFASQMAPRAVAACMQAMGAIGLTEDHPFSRHLIGARIAGYVDGTTEIQRDRIGVLLPKYHGIGGRRS